MLTAVEPPNLINLAYLCVCVCLCLWLRLPLCLSIHPFRCPSTRLSQYLCTSPSLLIIINVYVNIIKFTTFSVSRLPSLTSPYSMVLESPSVRLSCQSLSSTKNRCRSQVSGLPIVATTQLGLLISVSFTRHCCVTCWVSVTAINLSVICI
jgi:hypothetical protein